MLKSTYKYSDLLLDYVLHTLKEHPDDMVTDLIVCHTTPTIFTNKQKEPWPNGDYAYYFGLFTGRSPDW